MQNTQSKPFAKMAEIAPVPLVGKRPQTWGTALEMCRLAKGWTQKEMLAQALKGENVSVTDIKRWEQMRSDPTPNQVLKLRNAMLPLAAYDDLLKLPLRPYQRSKAPELRESIQPEGWPGAPVKAFADALRWARVSAGMSQPDLGRLIGIGPGTISNWESGETTRLIKGMYENVCEALPCMQHAPKPEFSVKFTNAIRKKGFLEAQEHQQNTARAVRAVEETIGEEQRAKLKVIPMTPALDRAAMNQAAAAYGLAVGNVRALEAELVKLKKRHDEEQLAKMTEIEAAKAEMTSAEVRMHGEVTTMHGGEK